MGRFRYWCLLFSFIGIVSSVAFGQKSEDCDVKGLRKPKFKIASESAGETLGLRIVVESKFRTDQDLIVLARYFNQRHCNYDEIIVTVFDNKKDAREFSVYQVKQIPDTPRAMYYLNRETRKEKLVRIKVVDNKQVETPIDLS